MMQTQQKKFIKLRKVSFNYSPVEDRILMKSQAEEGGVYDFWLTHRLCREIVRVLSGKISASALKVTSSSQAPTVEHFLQKQAISRKKPATKVPEKPSQITRPESAQVQTVDQGIILRFPLSESEIAALPLSFDEARQWLAMLYQQFKNADWPLGLWPDWITQKSDPDPLPAGKAFH